MHCFIHKYYLAIFFLFLLLDASRAENFTTNSSIDNGIYLNESEFYGNNDISYQIKLKRGAFTPNAMTGSEINEYFLSLDLTLDRVYVLVQFNSLGGDPSDAEIQNLSDDNVTLLGSLADHTYIAKFPLRVLETKSYPFVRWISILDPVKKLSSNLDNYTNSNSTTPLNITIVFFEGLNPLQQDEFSNYSNIVISNDTNFTSATFTTNTSLIGNLSELNFVKWLEYYTRSATTYIDTSSRVIASQNVWPYFDTSGVTVGIIDSGLQFNHPFFSSVAKYAAWDYVGNDSNPEAEGSSHGTRVAGIISGSGIYSGRSLRGISDKATLVIQRYLDSSEVPQGPEPWYNDMWRNIIDPGNNASYSGPWSADVISISWGIPFVEPHGEYSLTAQKMDDIIRGSLGKEVSIVTAVGNDGKNVMVSSLSTSKNAITVGATADFTTSNNVGGSGGVFADSSSLYVLNFSQRGTIEGRMKPDVLAPGSDITSTKLPSSYESGWGTSWSAPHVAALCAQIIQLYAVNHGWTNIYPESIKAFIVGSTVGGSTTNSKNISLSWGRIDAYRTIYKLNDEYDDQLNTEIVGEPGSGYYQDVWWTPSVPSGADRLEVTLVYSDPPGDVLISEPLKNDLDLYLKYPNGTTLQYTVDDDIINNVEKYIIPSGQLVAGTWELHVRARDLEGASGSQRFAIKWQTIKKIATPSLSVSLNLNSTVIPRGYTFDAIATILMNGVFGYDFRSYLSATSGVSVISGTLDGTDADKETIGDLNAGGSADTRHFTLRGDTTGSKSITMLANGATTLGGTVSNSDVKIVTVKAADGDYPCTADSECYSNYCDSDGQGLHDDNWCFSPYSTYFDGQEPSYCEYSTDNGIADCDERQVGDDLNKCEGITYYEDECSSMCNYQDVTTVFECTDTSCSCTQPLCDGKTTGDNIVTCSAGQTYFADKCTATASGEDRGDNICRSSAFDSTCTACVECNGLPAGQGLCNANCVYTPPLPWLGTRLITPTGDTNVTQNEFFNVTTEVCCYNADCGSVTVSLDPQPTTLPEASRVAETTTNGFDKNEFLHYLDNESDPHAFTKPFSVYELCNPKSDNHFIEGVGGFNVSFKEENNGKLLASKVYLWQADVQNVTYNQSYFVNDGTNETPHYSLVEKYVTQQEDLSKWVPFEPQGFKINGKECMKIKVQGHKKATIGESAVDNIVGFAGFDFPEYAWWNSSFLERKSFIINTSEARTRSPFLVNVTGLSVPSRNCSIDLRLTNNSDTEVFSLAVVSNGTTTPPIGSRWCQITFIENTTAGNNTFWIYDNNSYAVPPTGYDKLYFVETFDQYSDNQLINGTNGWYADSAVTETNLMASSTTAVIAAWPGVISNGAIFNYSGSGATRFFAKNLTVNVSAQPIYFKAFYWQSGDSGGNWAHGIGIINNSVTTGVGEIGQGLSGTFFTPCSATGGCWSTNSYRTAPVKYNSWFLFTQYINQSFASNKCEYEIKNSTFYNFTYEIPCFAGVAPDLVTRVWLQGGYTNIDVRVDDIWAWNVNFTLYNTAYLTYPMNASETQSIYYPPWAWWNSSFKTRKALTLNTSETRVNSPFLVNVTDLQVPSQNCTIDLRLTTATGIGLRTLNVVANDTTTSDPGQRWCQIAFLANTTEKLNQTFYLYDNNSFAVPPTGYSVLYLVATFDNYAVGSWINDTDGWYRYNEPSNLMNFTANNTFLAVSGDYAGVSTMAAAFNWTASITHNLMKNLTRNVTTPPFYFRGWFRTDGTSNQWARGIGIINASLNRGMEGGHGHNSYVFRTCSAATLCWQTGGTTGVTNSRYSWYQFSLFINQSFANNKIEFEVSNDTSYGFQYEQTGLAAQAPDTLSQIWIQHAYDGGPNVFLDDLWAWNETFNLYNTSPKIFIGPSMTDESKSLVSPITGAKPFYTTNQNPTTISLSQNACQNVSWAVNATGEANKTYTFFAYAYKTSNPAIGNMTETIEVTITKPLWITRFEPVYAEGTERVFRFDIENSWNSTLANVSWALQTGQNNESSIYDATLTPGETLQVFVYHNYTSPGSFNVTAQASANGFFDSKTIEIIV
ncbi:MAG: S8 family serine peptidase [Candidatus Micrarchaeota archaeon]